jgi:hypothetical protein
MPASGLTSLECRGEAGLRADKLPPEFWQVLQVLQIQPARAGAVCYRRHFLASAQFGLLGQIGWHIFRERALPCPKNGGKQILC